MVALCLASSAYLTTPARGQPGSAPAPGDASSVPAEGSGGGSMVTTTIYVTVPYVPGSDEPPMGYPPERVERIVKLFEALSELPGVQSLSMTDYRYGHPVVPYGRRIVVNLHGTLEERAGEVEALLRTLDLAEGADIGLGEGPDSGPRDPTWR